MFYDFFSKSKNMTLRFFALFHTFSWTMVWLSSQKLTVAEEKVLYAPVILLQRSFSSNLGRVLHRFEDTV